MTTSPAMIGDLFASACRSVRTKGVRQASKVAGTLALDVLFDWRYGTDTIRWVPSARLATESPNRSRSGRYQATTARPFRTLLHRLAPPLDCTFVDVGCGKGRVLLMAAALGFRRVVGIEFSAPLCAIARRNIELFCAARGLRASIELVEGDASDYRFRPDERVIFMYNPFDGVVLAKVVEHLRQSLREAPRRLSLIYNTPLHHAVIDGSGLFRGSTFHEIGGMHFRVYVT